ncbi:hypothetical protein Tbd_1017 [Thiobacillus denitrificans ATCC 25259]|uniref:Transcriptional regulator-like domain-containing protein n=1 Tax=Thiobacillus denitrificans (strain ATCC 25259 / T1) TaxID=292415 RepID=Q3SK24_THIDA|nr:DUF6499 domain-containing protein [Thiobacillus denitrificans]AAZ96970.1 hypothetical protein Tbd_1017 [Thiobacillus denitrificans ATCC 25259]
MTADAYAYCATLTRDQWAWEFLRRNPDYQRDYRAFIAIWRALEADYGAPPDRDFSKWKRDPRAYGPLPGEAEVATPKSELCTVDDERVLLECWMGAKWGFYKFPLDPACIAPAPDELSWRPPPQQEREIEAPYRLDVAFDLSLPLPPQLEAAKFRLVSRAADLRRQGYAAPKTVANQRAHWTTMLRLLDGAAAADADATGLLDEARTLAAGGYREIPRLTQDAHRPINDG